MSPRERSVRRPTTTTTKETTLTRARASDRVTKPTCDRDETDDGNVATSALWLVIGGEGDDDDDDGVRHTTIIIITGRNGTDRRRCAGWLMSLVTIIKPYVTHTHTRTRARADTQTTHTRTTTSARTRRNSRAHGRTHTHALAIITRAGTVTTIIMWWRRGDGGGGVGDRGRGGERRRPTRSDSCGARTDGGSRINK